MPRSTTSAAIGRDHVSTGLDYADLAGAFERELGRWDPAVGALLDDKIDAVVRAIRKTTPPRRGFSEG